MAYASLLTPLQSHPTPCLLKPPPLLGSLKVLDDTLPITSPHAASFASLDIKSKVPKLTNTTTAQGQTNTVIPASFSPTIISPSDNQSGSGAVTATEGADGASSTFQRSSSYKKSSSRHGGSTKRKKPKTKSESDTCDLVVLNNGREKSQITRSDQHILQAVNRIQNDTKEEPFNRATLTQRRMSSVSGSSLQQQRRASLANNQLYMNLGRRSSKNINSPVSMSRRMSSIEQVYEKVSNINIYNFEQPAQVKTDDKTKLDIGVLQQSLANINIPRRTSTVNEYCEMQVPSPTPPPKTKIGVLIDRLKPHDFIAERETYSLYLFPETNRYVTQCPYNYQCSLPLPLSY